MQFVHLVHQAFPFLAYVIREHARIGADVVTVGGRVARLIARNPQTFEVLEAGGKFLYRAVILGTLPLHIRIETHAGSREFVSSLDAPEPVAQEIQFNKV